MNDKNLNKLWNVTALFLVGYTGNAFLQDRRGTLLFKEHLVDNRHVPNDYFSIIVVGVILGLISTIGVSYSRRVANKRNQSGMPVVYLEPEDRLDLPMRAYQGFCFFAFVVVPFLALFQFWGQLTAHGRLFEDVQVRPNDPPVPGHPLNTLDGIETALTLLPNGKRFCLVTSDDAYRFSGEPGKSGSPCSDSDMKGWSGGIDFIPIFSPTVLILSTAFGWLGAVYLSYSLLMRRSRVKGASLQGPQG